MCWQTAEADPYLSQAVLDLQFGHSQRVGYDVATNVLSQLQRIGNLHKPPGACQPWRAALAGHPVDPRGNGLYQ